MIYKSYLIEQNFDIIKQNITLFYGENIEITTSDDAVSCSSATDAIGFSYPMHRSNLLASSTTRPASSPMLDTEPVPDAASEGADSPDMAPDLRPQA